MDLKFDSYQKTSFLLPKLLQRTKEDDSILKMLFNNSWETLKVQNRKN